MFHVKQQNTGAVTCVSCSD